MVRRFLVFCFSVSILSTASCSPEADVPQQKWFKGNLHTHSLWSDGDDYPEMIVGWYKDEGYDFIALSDHNTLADGDRWSDTERNSGGAQAYQRYLDKYGDTWVETKASEDTTWVRLKTLEEYRSLFEVPDSFLVIRSEEITSGFDGKPIHINATNIMEFIEPRDGVSIADVMQRNVDAVLEQRERTGVPMFPHINHPNFGWAITAEDLILLEGEQFFEVYNGHPAVHNEGDAKRPGMERVWDIILTRRILHNEPIMYGLAVDDSHNYHEMGSTKSNPGRAWVMVQADTLSANALVEAMEQGDFYGSTGVTLQGISFDKQQLSLVIEPEAGVTYETHFIGTRAGHDSTSTPVQLEDGSYVTRSYSDEIGEVLAKMTGTVPVYQLEGDELYVRAKVISSKPKVNPYQAGETEMAWTQPVF